MRSSSHAFVELSEKKKADCATHDSEDGKRKPANHEMVMAWGAAPT